MISLQGNFDQTLHQPQNDSPWSMLSPHWWWIPGLDAGLLLKVSHKAAPIKGLEHPESAQRLPHLHTPCWARTPNELRARTVGFAGYLRHSSEVTSYMYAFGESRKTAHVLRTAGLVCSLFYPPQILNPWVGFRTPGVWVSPVLMQEHHSRHSTTTVGAV